MVKYCTKLIRSIPTVHCSPWWEKNRALKKYTGHLFGCGNAAPAVSSWDTMLLPRQQVHPPVGCIYLCQHIALKSNLPWFVVDDRGRAQEAGGYYQIYPWRNVLPSWTVCNLPKLLLLLWWNSAHLIRIMLLTRHSFREEEMQELNRRTNSRMAWLGFLSLAICLSVAGLQLWHLKNFFERKKLLWFILLLTDKI